MDDGDGSSDSYALEDAINLLQQGDFDSMNWAGEEQMAQISVRPLMLGRPFLDQAP